MRSDVAAPSRMREGEGWTMIDEAKLAELERLASEATPGPWRQEKSLDNRIDVVHSDHVTTPVAYYAVQTFEIPRPPDAAFIAAARTAVPDLVAEVRRLRGDLSEATCALGEIGDVSESLTQRAIRTTKAEAEKARLVAALRGLVEASPAPAFGSVTAAWRSALAAAKAALGEKPGGDK